MLSIEHRSTLNGAIASKNILEGVKSASNLNAVEKFFIGIIDWFTKGGATDYLQEKQWKETVPALLQVADTSVTKNESGADQISISTPELGHVTVQDLTSTELMSLNIGLRNEGLLSSTEPNHLEGIRTILNDGSEHIEFGTTVKDFQKKVVQHIITNRDLYSIDTDNSQSAKAIVKKNALNTLIAVGTNQNVDVRNNASELSDGGETLSQLALSIIKTNPTRVKGEDKHEIHIQSYVHLREMSVEENPVGKGVYISFGLQVEEMRGVDLADLRANLREDIHNHPQTYTLEAVRNNCLVRVEQGQALTDDEIKIVFSDCLKRIGTGDFDADDLKIFKAVFALTDESITSESLPKLTPRDIEFLVSMRTHPVNSAGWNHSNTAHLLSMLNFGLTNGLTPVYKLIFTEQVLKQYVEIANEIHFIQMKYIPKSSDEEHAWHLGDGTKVSIHSHGGPMDRVKSVQITIGEVTEKLTGVIFSELKERIIENKTDNQANYYDLDAQQGQKFQDRFNQSLVDSSEDYLQKTLPGFKTLGATHTAQSKLDWHRTGNVTIQIMQENGESAIHEFQDLINKEGKFLNTSPEFTPEIIHTIQLLGDQNYRSLFGYPIEGSVALVTKAVEGDANDKKSNQIFNFVFPTDFSTKHQLDLEGSLLAGNKKITFGANMKFSDDFYEEIKQQKAMDSKEFGVEETHITKVEITGHTPVKKRPIVH